MGSRLGRPRGDIRLCAKRTNHNNRGSANPAHSLTATGRGAAEMRRHSPGTQRNALYLGFILAGGFRAVPGFGESLHRSKPALHPVSVTAIAGDHHNFTHLACTA